MIDSASDAAGAGPDLRKKRRMNSTARDARATADRLPPHSSENEQGVVGCALLSPAEMLDALDDAGVQAEWFYDLRHAALVDTMLVMHRAGEAVDLITVQERLRQRGLLEECGGIPYLSACQDAVPSAANLAYYLETVREKWLLRKMVQTASGAVGKIYDYDGEVAALCDEVSNEFLRLTDLAEGKAGCQRRVGGILVEDVLPGIETHYHRGSTQMEGYTTGLEYLDKMYGGLGGENGNYHVIAGRPGTGKTALAIQIAAHLALDYVWWGEKKEHGQTVMVRDEKTGELRAAMERHVGQPVGIFSLEMSMKSLTRRMLFQRAEGDMQRWRTGFATNADLAPLQQAAGRLTQAPIYIDDSSGITIGQLKARARRWHRQHGVRFFIIDYFQLLRADSRRQRASQVEELEEISHEILSLGKELDCPIIVLCQMNRNWEQDPTRTPQLSDLKGCGAVEQDAHTVTFLYKPRLSDTNKEFFEQCMEAKFGANWRKWDGHPQRVNALIAKNREGPTGPAQLLFLRASTKFHDWNAWLKKSGYKGAAKGEEFRYQRDAGPDKHTESTEDTEP